MDSPARLPLARRGLLFVLSSPSGAGKSSICRALLRGDPDLVASISATTRPMRPGERHEVDYYFLDRDRFRHDVEAGEFLEWAEIYGNLYGTPRGPVLAALEAGRDVLFDIDWQGAQQLRERAGVDVVTVFVLPPSLPELRRRLVARAQDDEPTIRRRMDKAADEIGHYGEYDYVIINQDLDESIARCRAILEAERLRRSRLFGLAEFVRVLREGVS